MVSLDKLQELNKWWTKGNQFYIDDADLIRYRSSQIKIIRMELFSLLKPGKILVIKGPRRAGKSVSIKLAILKLLNEGKANQDDIFYFSFDTAITVKDMDATIRNFLNKPHSGSTYIFLDEIQAVKNWADALLGLSNSGALKNTSVVVTGSIAHFLGAETLPGRGTEGNIYYMRTASFRDFVLSLLDYMKENQTGWNRIVQRVGYTFSSNEVGSMLDAILNNSVDLEGTAESMYKGVSSVERYFIPLSKMFDLYMLSGGYPVSIEETMMQFKSNNSYEEIYNYIKNDAATITSAVSGDPMKAGQAVSGVLSFVGSKVSYSKIAGTMSMNKATLIDYMDRLENSFVFLNVKGMKSSGKLLKDSEVKKFYFSDVFMHYSAGAAMSGKPGETYSKEMINSGAVGSIVEELVAGHLIRTKEQDPMRLYGTYLKFYDGRKEIDFIYKKDDGKTLGIEVKYQNSASTQDINRAVGVDAYILLTKSLEIRATLDGMVFPVCLFLVVLKNSSRDM